MDLVITVCDQAAGESCPVWPGHPAQAHWSAPDPAPHMDDPAKAMQVIENAFALTRRRIEELTSLPMLDLETRALQRHARAIGHESPLADDPGHRR